jgi:NAD-dependent dihydropyrimidine dehydrogenase PreA subunit
MEEALKGIICYYSATGNTRLICDKLGVFLDHFSVELCDMQFSPPIHPQDYDFFGFATSVEFFGLPYLTQQWIKAIPKVSENKLAFILLSHGSIPGTALLQLKELVEEQNFKVFAGHTLHCPENYPPLRSKGFKSAKAPSEKELKRFLMFSYILKDMLLSASKGTELLEAKFRLGLLNHFFNLPDKNAARRVMGFKYIDENLCTRCGICAQECPHRAIRLEKFPVFSEELCRGCWKCYNRCPVKAIYTRNLRGTGHYREPGRLFQDKMEALKLPHD